MELGIEKESEKFVIKVAYKMRFNIVFFTAFFFVVVEI